MAVEISAALLASHKTLATFGQLVDQPCMFRTSLCPHQCGHGGQVAIFDVDEYVAYDKPGQYGDAQQQKHHIKLSGEPEDVQATIRGLEPGTKVRLDWDHVYITRTEPGGGQSKYPERPTRRVERV